MFGASGPTAHRRFTEWGRARVWAKLHRLVLDELGGRYRWTIERTVALLAGCRHLHHRYEQKAERLLAFVGIAAALICYRRLTK